MTTVIIHQALPLARGIEPAKRAAQRDDPAKALPDGTAFGRSELTEVDIVLAVSVTGPQARCASRRPTDERFPPVTQEHPVQRS